jgi:hypothetical protein
VEGSQEKTLELTTQSQGIACGYSFSKGRKYLVDATGKMSVDICSETKPLSEASELVEALGNGETPGEGGDALTDTSGVVSVRAMVGMVGMAMVASFLVMVRIVRSS